uniref:non-specific serine/threonine protein kinase n=1 Tax=Chromulina nebulosa TaxID=96789 RepID=A0A7S0XCH5_9STRA|mmetsp:Transcript_2207/g.1974  ORF Transcript_2207/g.1974 Transcript_2207/m.1974 type:complete len:861 (+) Transcript_2207:171-2753(+)
MMMPFDGVIQVSSYDGQTIWYDRSTALFEVGNFLGGGAAGTVYECENSKSRDKYALKILNPIGYKLMSPTLLRKCTILNKGKIFSDLSDPTTTLTADNVWWLLNSSNKQYITAYYSEKSNCLKELSLNQCIQIWTTNPPYLNDSDDDSNAPLYPINLPNGQKIFLPKLPPKYVEFIRKRNRIFREINNMKKISNHINVIRLEGVLELAQESKCTIFLIMELANGGELFDRIKVDCGTREETAKYFFQQLLGGVKHCHDQGVCHRDLKPENLLLQDGIDNATILKIADFGFSARFAMASDEQSSDTTNDNMWIVNQQNNNRNDQNISHIEGSPVRILKSIVGSPFYVAPEILQARGYDGPKADIWSLGVILYAMLAGNLPFGQDLSTCKRFKTFCKWISGYNLKGKQLWNDPMLVYPDWLFPAKFSNLAKGLIVSMLHPDPCFRISVSDAMSHPLCVTQHRQQNTQVQQIHSHSAITNTLSTDTNAVTSKNDEINSSTLSAISTPPKSISPKPDKHVRMVEDVSIINSDDVVIMDEDEKSDRDYDDQSGVFEMEEDIGIDEDKIQTQTVNVDRNLNSQLLATTRDIHSDTSGNYQTASKHNDNYVSPFSQSPALRSSFQIAYSPYTNRPPMAPAPVAPHAIDDLITYSDDDEYDPETPLFPGLSRKGSDNTRSRNLATVSSDDGESKVPNNIPPSFNDAVKRSTRFITSVPASQVLLQVESILEDCRVKRYVTPIGYIGKILLNWENFRLDIWGSDISGPVVCSLQLYHLPSTYDNSTSPNTNNSHSNSLPIVSPNSIPQELNLVEFIRGQIEIFGFKRFYQWLRQRLSELVKRDYNLKQFELSFSPKVDYQLLQKFNQFS